MRYFKYENTNHSVNTYEKDLYKSLSKEEKRIVRKDKLIRRFANAVGVIVFCLVFVLVCGSFEMTSFPSIFVLRLLCYIFVGLFIVCGFSFGVAAGLLTATFINKLTNDTATEIMQKYTCQRKNYLKDYYGIDEPYKVTKCYEASDKRFVGKDVCLFTKVGELRITVDMVNNYIQEESDLGCCAFRFDEIKVQESSFDNMVATEISDGENVFLLGRRAMGYIKSNVIDRNVN